MLDIWHAVASHIDIISPNIYREDFWSVCYEYARLDNPLFIPETVHNERSAAYVFYAIGQHSAIGFSPFAIDDIAEPESIVDDGSYGYRHTASLWREIRARVRGFSCELGDYRLQISFTRELAERVRAFWPGFPYESKVPAAGLIIAVENDKYTVAGTNFLLKSLPKDNFSSNVEILWVDEGSFRDGEWILGRRLNGDETGHGSWVYFDDKPRVHESCIIKVHSHPLI